jgi:chromosome segregation ATPase
MPQPDETATTPPRQPDLAAAKEAAAAVLQARVHTIHAKLSQLEPSPDLGSTVPEPPLTAVPLNQTGENLLQLLDRVADRLTRADVEHRQLTEQVGALRAEVQQETRSRTALEAQVRTLEATMAQQAKQEQEDRLQQLTEDNSRLQATQNTLQQRLE